MKAMNKVASHINEMQKIHEEFGAVFDQLITEQSGDKKEVRPTPGSLESVGLPPRKAYAQFLLYHDEQKPR